MSLPDDAIRKLHMALPASRVHKREGSGGRSLDYIATHDAIRTANAIFDYGQWGHEVVALDLIATEQVVSRDGQKKGWRVGYRCTVRLTVAGCVPTSGVGYGDAQDYQDSTVTPHELAMKEAESDALKRALKNFGDQFGLSLYAKPGDERARVEREAAVRRERALKVRPDSGASPAGRGDTEPNESMAGPPASSSQPDLGGPAASTPAGSEGAPTPSEPSPFQAPTADPKNKPAVQIPSAARTVKKLDVTVAKGRDNGWWTTEDVYALAHDIAPQIVGQDPAFYRGDDGELHWSDLRTLLPLWACSQMIDALTAQGELAAARSAA